MTKIQTKSNPLPNIPRVSIFDKRGQLDMARINKGPNMNANKHNVNLPQVRISQHKGA